MGGGQEWHSTPFTIQAGQVALLRCDGTARFYAALVTETDYVNARTRSPLAFPFRRGSDRTTFETSVHPAVPAQYRIVLRVGAFAPPARLMAVFWIARGPSAPPAPAPAPLQDTSAEVERSRRGRRIAYGIGAIVLIIAIWLTWYNIVLFETGNLNLFDNTLNAEATAVIAIVAVIGGLFAVWRELVIKGLNRPS